MDHLQTYALLLTFGSTLSFSASSLVFAEFSNRVGVLWMNCFKALFALLLLIPTLALTQGWHSPETNVVILLLTSGLLGLNIADLFLLKAFTKIGAARTLMLYGFQPLIIGVGARILFGQELNPVKLVAVFFMIACLFTMSLEHYRAHKHWALTGLLLALAGITLDACGVLITRTAFEKTLVITPMEGHFWRCVGACAGFAVIALFKPIPLINGFMRWPLRERALILGASFGGTYLSLLLYLNAVKIGHLASLAGISITGPMFATTLECFIKRKPPSIYLIIAFVFFAAGFAVLLATS